LNFAQYPVDIFKNVVIPETQNTIAGSFNPTRAGFITFPLPIMLSAIEFDYELCFSASEINNERTNRDLSPEMRASHCNIITKPVPKHALGIGRLGAHSMRKFSLATIHRAGFNHIHSRLWTPTPDTSPQGGGVKEIGH
jgi:hypothetical protein